MPLPRWLATLRPPHLLGCILLILPMVLAWTLATPLGSQSDAAVSLIAAAADVRGEFGGTPTRIPWQGGTAAIESVRVPGRIVELGYIEGCLSSPDTLPSACEHLTPFSNAPTRTTTQFARYPPLFPLLEGWPTLFASGKAAWWSVTSVAVLINAIFLGLALWIGLRFLSSRLAGLGWLLTITPTVLYFTGSLHVSGFEMSTAIASWSGLLALALTDVEDTPLVIATAISTAMFAFTRPASPAWVLIAILICAMMAGRRRIAALSAVRSIRAAALLVLCGFVAAAAWRLGVGTPPLLPLGPPHPSVSITQSLQILAPGLSQQILGGFTQFLSGDDPILGLAAWLMMFGIVTVGGLAYAHGRRVTGALFALALLIGLVPLVAEIIYLPHGLFWESKDGVPLSVGLPLAAAAMLPSEHARGQVAGRVLVALLALFMVAEIVTFVFTLHRWTNGLDGAWSIHHFGWQPPGGVYVLTIGFVLATARVVWSVWACSRADSVPESGLSGPSIRFTAA